MQDQQTCPPFSRDIYKPARAPCVSCCSTGIVTEDRGNMGVLYRDCTVCGGQGFTSEELPQIPRRTS